MRKSVALIKYNDIVAFSIRFARNSNDKKRVESSCGYFFIQLFLCVFVSMTFACTIIALIAETRFNNFFALLSVDSLEILIIHQPKAFSSSFLGKDLRFLPMKFNYRLCSIYFLPFCSRRKNFFSSNEISFPVLAVGSLLSLAHRWNRLSWINLISSKIFPTTVWQKFCIEFSVICAWALCKIEPKTKNEFVLFV